MSLSRLFDGFPEELQAEMRLILNVVVEGLIGVDAQGKATFCNESLLRMIGYRANEVIGADVHALTHHSLPDGTKYPKEQCPLRKALDSQQPVHAAREFYWRKDGTCFPAECWVHPLPQPSGLTSCVVTVLDITERERAMEALRTSEERFRQISQNINQAFYLVDVTASRMVYVSPAFETITGHSCEEACTKPSPWRDLAVPEYRERVRAGYDRLIAGEEAKDEYQIRRSDGSTRRIKDHANPIRDANGRVVMFAGLVEDVTEIYEAREILRQSEEKFRRILASIPDVAWTADRDGRMTYVSSKVEAILGYTKQEICAAGASLWLGQIHPEDFGRVRQAYEALFEKQIGFDQEYRMRRKDGAWIWVHDRATGLHQENGVLCSDGVLTDITRRKEAEAELLWKTAFLEAQANSTIDGIVVIDGNGKMLMHNQRFVELFQMPAELLATSDQRAVLKYAVTLMKDPEPFMAKINHLNRHRAETSHDEIELRDGRFLDRYSAPVIGKHSQYYGRIWTFRDVTERRRSEDMLRQLSTAVEQSPASVIITNPKGDITYVNPKFTEVTGYRPEEVLGKNPRILNARTFPPDHYRDLWSTIVQGREWRGEFCNKKKNGEIFWESATIRPITDAQGAITHYLALKEDITERRQAEQEVRASRQMLQSILDAIPQRVFWKDRNCTYLGCNRPFALDAGLGDPAAIVSKSDFDLSWASMAELYRADDRLVMERGAAKLNFQEVQTRPDGSTLWLQTNKLPLFDLEGKVTGVVGTYEDITDRKRAERELRLTQFSLEHASDAVEWIDPESRIVYANEAECRALGYSREELLSLTIPDIDPIFRKEVWATFWQELKTRGSMAFETQHKNKRGLVFPVEVTANYLEFDGQEYCFAFARDITERKRAETELRLTQFAVEHASEAIERIDREGHLMYVNEAGCRDLGYSSEELLALSVSDINPQYSKENWQRLWSEIKSRRSMTIEAEHRTKQGQIFPVEITANYMEFDGQEYVVAFARNVAERRALESQLRQAQKLEGIGQLASGIAHEINTPAQFVTDNTTFLKESSVPLLQLLSLAGDMRLAADAGSTSKELLARFDQQVKESDLPYLEKEIPKALEQSLDGLHRISKIVRAMKEFSHPGSGEKVPTDINRALETTITVARNEWKYVAELETEFDTTLPLVPCLQGEFNQAMLNLIVNAAQAIAGVVGDGSKGKGRITITTRRAEQSVEIAIHDTGPGIPSKIQSRIFEPFFTTKPVGKGTGQGLSLAHSTIVKRHRGRIWFESEVGRGTTFFVHLPLQAAAAEAGG